MTLACHCRHAASIIPRSEEHTSELQSQSNIVCRLLLEKKQQAILLFSWYVIRRRGCADPLGPPVETLLKHDLNPPLTHGRRPTCSTFLTLHRPRLSLSR